MLQLQRSFERIGNFTFLLNELGRFPFARLGPRFLVEGSPFVRTCPWIK